MSFVAEVISVGDEIIGGAKLDTNTQWIADQLSQIGVEVAFHSTVGDTLANQVAVFRTAAARADIVVVSGGLGPTADDLTRQAMAELMNVSLVEDRETIVRIKAIFQRYGREMPERNKIQALFPDGSRIIENPEGTAPGIDATVKCENRSSRFFCLPGVPAEMKFMLAGHVRNYILSMLGTTKVIETRVINCFGAGESQIESMLGDLIERGRDPLVGITASRSVISLRVTAKGSTPSECQSKIDTTEAFIRQRLGDMVFGVGDESLGDIVVRELVRLEQTISVIDYGLDGEVASALAKSQTNSQYSKNPFVEGRLKATFVSSGNDAKLIGEKIRIAAQEIRRESKTALGVAISPIYLNSEQRESYLAVILGDGVEQISEFTHTGHSSFRQHRSVLQVLDVLRRFLQARCTGE